MKAYLATSFFNEANYMWTEELARNIRWVFPEIDLYVPQENDEINDKDNVEGLTAMKIALGDNQHLEPAELLIACLDGVEIDSGVSAEIGYFAGLMKAEKIHTVLPKNRKIIGIYTDIRRDGEGDNRFYINQYTKGLVDLNGVVVHNTTDLLKEINKYIRGEK